MPREKAKKEKSYSIHPAWKWIIFAAVIIYGAITIITQQAKINEQKQAAEEFAEAERELTERIEALESELSYMGTYEYVERTARERLGMVKEGEIIFKDESEKDG